MADTKISDETDAGTLDGAEIVPVVKGGNNRRTTAQDIADLAPSGSGGGLFAGVMSAVPTTANTGLSTWVNQDSSVLTETAVGLTIERPSAGGNDKWALRTKAVPGATPYSATALLAIITINAGNTSSVGFGWYDGSNKMHFFRIVNGSGAGIYVSTMTTPTGTNANIVGPFASIVSVPKLMWVRLRDDGTNVYFEISIDGANFETLSTVAKSSGFLGSSGYTNLFFGAAANGNRCFATLMSYAEV